MNASATSGGHGLTTGRITFFTFCITFLVWLAFTWPLPRYVFDGIPASHSPADIQPARHMIAGDHLQLLYYFWLFGDMMRGQSPWFYNFYEFHTGNPEERYDRTTYYVPFSLIYAVLEPAAGRPFAFNAVGFLSLWLTYLLTALLVRRYVGNPWIILSMSLLGILVPYRWFAFLGGSPTGYAMLWVPMLLLGLDRAVRDGRILGGLTAGLAVLLAFATDIHVFFFSVLITPAWCVIALAARDTYSWRAYRSIALGLLPAVALALLTVWYSQSETLDMTGTHMAEGRDLREVMAFSPERKGFFAWEELPVSSQVYFGYTAAALLLAGFVVTALRLARRRPDSRRPAIILGLLLATIAGAALLSLGPHSPRGGWLFLSIRELIPPYAMIRQTGKIFCLIPSLLAVACAWSLTALIPAAASRRTVLLAALIPTLLMIGEYGRRTRPTVSLLHREQPAYAAVADDAARSGHQPHMLVVTLWPGDTHYASIYQYYASLYHIYMINGYTPVVRRDYYTDVFERFQSINQGWMTDEQADDLIGRGIRYIVVHEDLFPEKVSPFPIAYTLKSFHDHPRLRFLAQSGPVWSFRILDEPEPRAEWMPEWDLFFPARHPEFEHATFEGARIVRDDTASNREFLRMDWDNAFARMRPVTVQPAPALHWKVRARGKGLLEFDVLVDDLTVEQHLQDIDTTDWTWFDIPIPLTRYGDVALQANLRHGNVDFDLAVLSSGHWPMPEPGESFSVMAALFCHAGHMNDDRHSVRFRPVHDRASFVFYGPKLPFEAGVYAIEIAFSTDAPDGEELGFIQIAHDWNTGEGATVPVVAGQPARGVLTQSVNLPFNVVLIYHATAVLDVHEVIFTRLE